MSGMRPELVEGPSTRSGRIPSVARPIGTLRAIAVALEMTWRRPLFYLLTVVAVQLVLVLLAVPLLQTLYALVLTESGLGSLAYDEITTVLTNPLADLTLLLLAGVATLVVFAELATLFVLASHHQRGDAISFRLVLRQVWSTVRKLLRPQGLLMIGYLLVLLPLGHLGLSSTLTKRIAVPPFVSGELAKSATSNLAYRGLLLVLSYLTLRLIFTIPLLATTTAGVWSSMVTSWRLTRWRSLRVLGVLALVGLMGLGVAGWLLLATMSPTVVSDILRPELSPVVATLGLTGWQIGAFVVTALATITLAQALEAMARDWLFRLPPSPRHDVHEIDYAVPSRVSPRHRRALVVTAASLTAVVVVVGSLANYSALTKLAAAEETSIIAHRGFVTGGVENTIPALRAAAAAGADRVEFDVLQTKDLKFVVIHDTNLKRLAGIDANVKDLTQAELTAITVRDGSMEAKIPSLEEWIAESKRLDLPQLLEVKIHGGESPDLLPRLLSLLDREQVADWYTYHSISRPVVEGLERLRPELVVGFIIPITFGGVPAVQADFLVLEQASYTDDVRAEAWGRGYKVVVWTVDEEDLMRRYMGDDVNGIISDRPDVGVQARDDIQAEEGLADRLYDMVVRSSSF
jgi:glycerophosphoryl diester phosphodiesterase